MTWDQIQTQWNEFAGSARAHWSKLTDDDGHAIAGTQGNLVGRIQRRYDITRQEAERQVDEWSEGLLEIVDASRAD